MNRTSHLAKTAKRRRRAPNAPQPLREKLVIVTAATIEAIYRAYPSRIAPLRNPVALAADYARMGEGEIECDYQFVIGALPASRFDKGAAVVDISPAGRHRAALAWAKSLLDAVSFGASAEILNGRLP